MKIGFLQFKPKLKDVETNIKIIRKNLEGLEKIDLIVLPELANSGYTFINKEELEICAETIPRGPFSSTLIDIAEKKNAYIVSGICEKESNRFYNSAITIGPDGYIATYRKMHLFDREKLFFTAGNNRFEPIDIGKAKIGVIICFDWIFPEATRILALKGADIIAHSANLVLPYSQTAMLSRSIENKVFTITANRIGTEKNGAVEIGFTGQSQITSPKMEVLQKAEKDTEEVKIVEIDVNEAKNKWLNTRNNLFKDRRIDFYKELIKKGFVVPSSEGTEEGR